MQDIAIAMLRSATAMCKQFPITAATILIMLIIIVCMIIYMAIHIKTGMPIAISRIQEKIFSNYAGFPVDRPELDAQSISYGEVTITNISTNEKVAIDIILHINGPGITNLTARADLIGPSGMILGKDDKAAKHSANLSFGEPQKYFRNTVELIAGQIERRQLVFLFKLGSESRGEFAKIMQHDQDYKFDLEITDFISGSKIIMHLPDQYRGDQ